MSEIALYKTLVEAGASAEAAREAVRDLPCDGENATKADLAALRDSGFVHALLQLPDYDSLAGHPIVGASWEGFVIENLLAASPQDSGIVCILWIINGRMHHDG